MSNPFTWPFLFTIPVGILLWVMTPDLHVIHKMFLAGVLVGTFISSSFCAVFAAMREVRSPPRCKKRHDR